MLVLVPNSLQWRQGATKLAKRLRLGRPQRYIELTKTSVTAGTIDQLWGGAVPIGSQRPIRDWRYLCPHLVELHRVVSHSIKLTMYTNQNSYFSGCDSLLVSLQRTR